MHSHSNVSSVYYSSCDTLEIRREHAHLTHPRYFGFPAWLCLPHREVLAIEVPCAQSRTQTTFRLLLDQPDSKIVFGSGIQVFTERAQVVCQLPKDSAKYSEPSLIRIALY